MTTPLFTAGAGAPCPRYKKLSGMKKDELIERVELLEGAFKGYYQWGKTMHHTLRLIKRYFPDVIDQAIDAEERTQQDIIMPTSLKGYAAPGGGNV